MRKTFSFFICFLAIISAFFGSCNNEKKEPPTSVIANSPQELQTKTEDVIRSEIDFAVSNNGKIDDSISLHKAQLVRDIYSGRSFSTLWSKEGQWLPSGDSVASLVERARLFGLFPEDYHAKQIGELRVKIQHNLQNGSKKMDAVLWSKADVLLTDAILQFITHLKLGRLPNDSVTGRKDSVITNEQFARYIDTISSGASLAAIISGLEPVHTGYHELKALLPAFLDSVTDRIFTVVPTPGKNAPDFKRKLQTRLFEGGYIQQDSTVADSLTLVNAIKRYQKENKIAVDGVAGGGTVRLLNLSDREKFLRIAITLDRYKLLPEKMPFRYIWVNVPSFYMQLKEADTLKLESKIIVGKPHTRTPLLTSAISELITYPQWTMPTSIIVKEVLPAAKKDPGYFARKGYSLIDSKGEVVDPYSVEWSKYSKGLPYKVVQGSGDDNALGILKFNFGNKYAVYLHDTNQRYLFARDFRSLSHGCVRVQEWEKLAYTIIRYDNATNPKTSPMEDSLGSWLNQKVKRSISIRNRLPVFIRYFACEARNGRIVFYDDIYGEDRELREKFFAGK